jgi:superfamily II DNA or RNA helicase
VGLFELFLLTAVIATWRLGRGQGKHMTTQGQENEFFKLYDLIQKRSHPSAKGPASHQSVALSCLDQWYESKPYPNAGGILVLPTGGGKTYTAIRFLCGRPISDGYKVLWLAHTHHLLEQAYRALDEGVSGIAESKSGLAVRVVSGVPGHYPVHRIKPSDDVVIGTLQTIGQACANKHPALEEFLKSAGQRLFVVFDEAHHAPAPSYRTLVFSLRERFREMYLLGLTATPTHTEKSKQGWLLKIFPQGIRHQVTPHKLMLAKILAKPVLIETKTDFTPAFDEREYALWVGTHRELPEDIITQLALSRERNLCIADYYSVNKKRFKKTIIFADRWHQCEQISEFLAKRKVRAGTIYSHVDADPGSAQARNKRNKNENTIVLEKFRRGDLDVLINVRMLTEGTDIPDVNTVFLTRATTSPILLTQMVGRALRGPAFGGTDEANIVSFIDNWKHLINWAEYDQIAEGLADETIPEYGKRPPIKLISIELVQILARQMDSGVNMTPGPFLSLLPVGWYRVEYQTQVEGSDDLELARELIMVFDNEQTHYEECVQYLAKESLSGLGLERESVVLAEVQEKVASWMATFFPESEKHFGTKLQHDLFKIARHIAQNGVVPRFFAFEERDRHNLDKIAEEFIGKNLGPLQVDAALRQEYAQPVRLWSTIYYRYDLFKSQYDACVNRILHAMTHQKTAADHWPKAPSLPPDEKLEGSEPSEELKLQVKQRDGFKCVCCGFASKQALVVDHISPHYYGGSNALENLQTLCKECNSIKSKTTINFRNSRTQLSEPLASLTLMKVPGSAVAGQREPWVRFLSHCVNFFFHCGAVSKVHIGGRGDGFYHWRIDLTPGNKPEWLKPHLKNLLSLIRRIRENAKYGLPCSLTVTAPGEKDVTYAVKK